MARITNTHRVRDGSLPEREKEMAKELRRQGDQPEGCDEAGREDGAESRIREMLRTAHGVRWEMPNRFWL
jgi:hypothetical protein